MLSKPNIPFFNYPAQFERREKELLEVMTDVMRRGAFIMQKDLKEFEENLAKFLGVKYAFGVADGSNAITLALLACGIKPGDEVIVPSHTFIASPSAIHAVGATPILADCGRDHMVDPRSVESLISKKTKAIMPVQVNGRTCNMDELQQIADKYGLIIVEDAAQALGSRFKNKPAATFGLAGTFSFYPAKLLGAFGDAGGIVTNDSKVADKIYMLRDHGRDPEGIVRCWGFNCRLDNVQAAILNFKLKAFPQEICRRRELAARYHEQLGDISEMLLPPGPEEDERHFDVYQNYEVQAERREELRAFLQEKGIRTIIQWNGTPVHMFEALGFTVKLPYTEYMFNRCFLLPLNTTLTNEEVDYICKTIRTFYGKGS